MWFVFILCGIISGLMFSNVDKVYKNDNKIPGVLGDCYRYKADPKDQLNGCPSEIPLVDDGKIVAARTYHGDGNVIPALSCNGTCTTYYAETKRTATGSTIVGIPFNSVIINPGCTIYVFQYINYRGKKAQYTGPELLSSPREEGIIRTLWYDGRRHKYVLSMLFTCKQVLPSCTPLDKWQVVTTLDNTDSTVNSKFSYDKTVGATYSQSMINSMSISATVSAEIEASFFGSFSSKLGVSATTGFDWTTTDTETKTESTTYSVDVNIPPGLRVVIEDAVGTCGGSSIHTQMYRVRDDKTNKTVRLHQGKMTNYGLIKRDFKKKN